MADTPLPLAELVKINDQNVSDVAGITDLLQDAPFFAAVLADLSSNGTDHKYLKEVTAPVVGFRDPNDGRDHDHGADELVTINLKILDASFHVDSAIADQFDTKPYGKGRDAFMADQANRHLRAAFKAAELQMINGLGQDAKGFVGLVDADTINNSDDAMVVNAGGSTTLSSVYLIRSVTDRTGFLLVTGNEGRINVGDEYQQMMAGAVGGKFNAYVQPIDAWLGAQLGSIHSVGRIANLDAGSNTLTDDLIADAIALFPEEAPPTHLVMNRRSNAQLQKSRTATNPTGAPAPFPTESFEIPIVRTSSVLNAETAVAPTGP